MAKIAPFENYTKEYEDWFATNRYVYLTELEAVKHYIPDGQTGIEIGVGSGLFAGPLGIKQGVDPSPKMAALAADRGISVIKGTAEKLPVEDEAYDFALMVTAVCFVDDVEQSFKEIRRILKKNGSAVIAFVDKNSPIGKIYLQHKHENKFYKDAAFFSTEEILDFLKKAGFGKTDVIQTVFGLAKDVTDVQPFKSGYGEGSFVVIKALKGE